MDQERNSWLAGSYRRVTVGWPVKDVDIFFVELAQVSRGRNLGHAAADRSELLGKLRKAYRAADQGADVLWVDAETGRMLVVQAKSYDSEGLHRRKGTEHPPAEGCAPTFQLTRPPECTHR